jgi:hypothetical protein
LHHAVIDGAAMSIRLPILFVAGLTALSAASADTPVGIPADGRHCALQAPPPEAGAYATPGGFLLAFPRNGGVGRGYTGCRTLWVVQGPGDTPLLMRLYFRGGRLTVAEAHDGRGGLEVRRCVLPSADRACSGLQDNPLAALDLPTWPRICTEQPELPACTQDPE